VGVCVVGLDLVQCLWITGIFILTKPLTEMKITRSKHLALSSQVSQNPTF